MGSAFDLLAPAFAIAAALAGAIGSLISGQPVTIPPLRTYFGKVHVEVDIIVKPLP